MIPNLLEKMRWHTLAHAVRVFLDALLATLVASAVISQDVADAIHVLALRLFGLFLNNPSLLQTPLQ